MRPTVHLPAAAAALLLAAAAPAVQAQRVATRAELAAILGATARTETFDDVTDAARGVYAASTHSAQPGPGLPLTSETVLPNRGAGLIEPGLAFSNVNNGHWFWPGQYGVFGNTSTVYSGGDDTQDIAFTAPTRAFGLDLWVFWYSSVATTVSVFDVGGRLVGSSTLTPTPGQFFGWQHEGGIGRVRLHGGTGDAVGVRMDDVTFGAGAAAPVTTAPEPATLTLVGAGLALVGAARRRRR